MGTYSGPVVSGITLTAAGQNPVTIFSTIANSGNGAAGDGVYGNNAAAWTIDNFGVVDSAPGGSDAIFLAAGGTVSNAAATAVIQGSANGVRILGAAGTIDNFGTIAATAASVGAGIELGAGGLVTNESTGIISAVKGAVSIDGEALGGAPSSTAATIVNRGTIIGKTGIGIGKLDHARNTIVNDGLIASTNGTSGTAINLGTVGGQLVVLETASSLVGVVANLQVGDAFDLTFIGNGSATLAAGNRLEIVGNGGAVAIALDPFASFAGDKLIAKADASGSGTLVTLAISGPPVASGQTLTVSAGQTSAGLDVQNGGTLVVLAGGVVSSTYDAGVEIVSAGGTDSGATVSGGGTLTIDGVASGATILSGGSATITGSAGNLVVSGGGSATIAAGGHSVSAVVGSFLSDGISISGLLTVMSGAVASGTLISGGGFGLEVVSGTEIGATVSGNGGGAFFQADQLITGSGLALNEVVRQGDVNVFDGGTISGATILGGVVIVSGGLIGGTAISNTVEGGVLDIQVGVGRGTTVSGSLASEADYAETPGGVIIDTVVDNFGFLQNEGGVSSNTVIRGSFLSRGGVETVGGAPGGLPNIGMDFNATVSSGGMLKVFPGGAASNTVVLSGGVLSVLGGFATEEDDGFVVAPVVSAGGLEQVAGGVTSATAIAGGRVDLMSGGPGVGGFASGGIDFRGVPGGVLQIDDTTMPTTPISGFAFRDAFDLTGVPFDPTGSAVVVNNGTVQNQLQVTEGGTTYALQLNPAESFAGVNFEVTGDAVGGSRVSEVRPPAQSPAVLNDFGWAQGWGSVDNPRTVADVNGDGSADYLGFGFNAVFIAYGGTFGDGQDNNGPGFAPAVASVNDFGTNEGYTAQVQRGAADVGVGGGDILYGQGFAGVFWYQATGATPQMDAAGNAYQQLQYQTTPNFYGNFGSQEGWSPANGFQILKTTATDATASILGFGDDGIVVGPGAFAPDATAAGSYVLDFQGGNSATTNAGNNFGWNQQVDIRTFTDANGRTLDLNQDGVADFVGMGPQGLEFAFGNENGPAGQQYQLGPLQTALVGANGTAPDLGEAQGWTDAATLRTIVADPQTGFDDILAFGAAGVYVAMGQDPTTHNNQPFAPLNLAMPDFGSNQGWSVGETPRLVGDINGDGVPDIVGFGFSNTFVALGSKDASGNLRFTVDGNLTIGNFGSSQGWSLASPNLTVRALAEFPGPAPGSSQSDLVLSGDGNNIPTQVWQFA